MDRIEFTLDGEPFELTADKVRAALRNQTPGRIQVYAVDVGGTPYPVKQALASALQIPKTRFISTRAVELLRKVGLTVIDTDNQSPIEVAQPPPAPEPRTFDPVVRESALKLAISHLSIADRPTEGVKILELADQFASWLATDE